MTKYPGITDELVSRAAGGDRIAMNQLIDLHREKLRRMISMRLSPRIAQRVDASDIVQDFLQTSGLRGQCLAIRGQDCGTHGSVDEARAQFLLQRLDVQAYGRVTASDGGPGGRESAVLGQCRERCEMPCVDHC